MNSRYHESLVPVLLLHNAQMHTGITGNSKIHTNTKYPGHFPFIRDCCSGLYFHKDILLDPAFSTLPIVKLAGMTQNTIVWFFLEPSSTFVNYKLLVKRALKKECEKYMWTIFPNEYLLYDSRYCSNFNTDIRIIIGMVIFQILNYKSFKCIYYRRKLPNR